MSDKFGLEVHLPELVERIVASYDADERTHHIDKQFLPSRIRIIEAVEMLLELLYPGYWGRQHLTSHNVSYHVGELLPRIGEILHEEIYKSFCYQDEMAGRAKVGGEQYRAQAKDIVLPIRVHEIQHGQAGL